METTYRLEFNEDQQQFHLCNYTHDENSFGWVTIIEHCTDLEFRIFESYVNRIVQEKTTIEYLLNCSIEVKSFMNNLLEYNIQIKQN